MCHHLKMLLLLKHFSAASGTFILLILPRLEGPPVTFICLFTITCVMLLFHAVTVEVMKGEKATWLKLYQHRVHHSECATSLMPNVQFLPETQVIYLNPGDQLSLNTEAASWNHLSVIKIQKHVAFHKAWTSATAFDVNGSVSSQRFVGS